MIDYVRSKRFWKRLGIGLAMLVAAGLIANGFMAWWMESKLQGRMAEIRAAGDPASVADLAPEQIPDEENVAAILESIRPSVAAFASEHGRFFNTPLGKAYDAARDRGEPASAEQIEAIRAILNRYPDVGPTAAKATARNEYASRLNYSLNSKQFIDALIDDVNASGGVRQLSRFLNWQIEVLLADGKTDEAVRRGIETYRIARLYESEPSLVAYLVAIAMRGVVAEQMYDALAAGPVSPELLAALDEELARMDDPQRLVHAIKTERAMASDWNGLVPGQPQLMLAHAIGWPMKSYLIGAIDYSSEYLELAQRPWYEVRDRFGKADSPPPPSGHGVLADLLQPAMRAVFQAHARSLAVSRALRVDIALRRFAEKHGREATGLEELNLPEDATTDPFTGNPLKLKHTDDGWVVYSVMENGVDDGGNFQQLQDYGVAPPKLRLTE